MRTPQTVAIFARDTIVGRTMEGRSTAFIRQLITSARQRHAEYDTRFDMALASFRALPPAKQRGAARLLKRIGTMECLSGSLEFRNACAALANSYGMVGVNHLFHHDRHWIAAKGSSVASDALFESGKEFLDATSVGRRRAERTELGEVTMAAISGSDALRFPPILSTRIAAEIEAIAWARSDLLNDIPEHDPDALYLAATYADAAVDIWETENDCPQGYLPRGIIDAARKALIPRIDAEIDRREELVWAEYQRRLRAGRIDVNGVGDVPTYYELEDIGDPPSNAGRESPPTGWMTPEELIMSIVGNWDHKNFWHFECPECGLGSAELGPADAHVLLCEVCLEEDDKPVRLRRWPVELSPLPVG